MTSRFKIHGTVAPGYEPVREAFEKHFNDGLEDNAQVCAYVDGVRVVDLWGTAVGNDGYNGDSLQVVCSSTKSLTAIVMASAVDRGLLDYSQKVSKYWPAFAKNGKEDVRVEDVLRHEAGLASFNHTFSLEDLSVESIKKNSIGRVIEEQSLRFPPAEAGTIRQYHAFTRGFILNEIFRRVDPQGRTVGEYLREMICAPLGADAFIGVTEEEMSRFQQTTTPGMAEVLLESVRPYLLGGRLETSWWAMLKMIRAVRQLATSQQVKPPPMLKGLPESITQFVTFMEQPDIRKGEIPSGNGSCSARGLARIGACVVNKGELDGVRILSQDAHDKMHGNYVARKDFSMASQVTDFSQGGVARYRHHPEDSSPVAPNADRFGYVGWAGLGGSVFQWHPELKIGFAYVPTRIAWYDFAFTKGGVLQAKVVQCAKAAKKA